MTKRNFMYRNINRDLYGVTSLTFILIAIVLADIALFEDKVLLGWLYAFIILASLFSILYSYCAKCPCKNNCSHIIPGYIAKIFKNRSEGPYSIIEISVVVFSLLLMMGFPQIWLWHNTQIFFAFWLLIVVGTLQIRTAVCKGCNNSFCPINSNYKHI